MKGHFKTGVKGSDVSMLWEGTNCRECGTVKVRIYFIKTVYSSKEIGLRSTHTHTKLKTTKWRCFLWTARGRRYPEVTHRVLFILRCYTKCYLISPLVSVAETLWYISHSTLIFAFKNFCLLLLKVIFTRFVEPSLGLIVYVTLKCRHIDVKNVNRNSLREKKNNCD
jgi:hypothetical protein